MVFCLRSLFKSSSGFNSGLYGVRNARLIRSAFAVTHAATHMFLVSMSVSLMTMLWVSWEGYTTSWDTILPTA